MDKNVRSGTDIVGAPMALAATRARAQPGLFSDPFSHAISLEFDCAGSANGDEQLATALRALHGGGQTENVIVGLGKSLAQRLGTAPAALRELAPLGSGAHGFVATPHDLWLLVPGDDAGAAFQSAAGIVAQLGAAVALRESTALFRYRDGRDLTGFRDGTENPEGEAAVAAALLRDARLGGGSFALVQRYVHAHQRFGQLAVGHQSLVIGRERESDEEIDAAPPAAHVKRTAQESYAPEAFLWRRSMPWGTPLRHGLQFIAFMAELDRAERMLRRMAGLEDGLVDALLAYTQAETGAYYFCPPLHQGRLLLAPQG